VLVFDRSNTGPGIREREAWVKRVNTFHRYTLLAHNNVPWEIACPFYSSVPFIWKRAVPH